jgi:hypothetical protein
MSIVTTAGALPVALQWTLGYSPVDVSSISATVAGTAATAAATVTCANVSGAVNCVLYGLDDTVVADGVVAQVTVNLSPTTVDVSTAIPVSGVVASTRVGTAISASGTGTVIAIAQSSGSVGVSALSCSPAALVGAGSVSCTVTLSGPAPSGGLAVSLASSSASLVVPASVTVASGSNTAGFTGTASAVSANVTVVITASANGSTQTSSISLSPSLQVSALSCSPAAVIGSGSVSCTVSLNGLAGVGGLAVSLASNSASLVVPASVTVPAGSNSAGFTGTASAVSANVTAVITAAVNGSAQTSSIALSSLQVSALACSPTTVAGAATVSCTVTLNGLAGAGGLAVSLASSSSSLVVPTSVTVAAGSNSAGFTGTVSAVSANVTAVITASANGSAQTSSIALSPLQVWALACSPTTVVGAGSVSCTVTLNGQTAASGLAVALASSSSSLVVPASVTVAAGSNSAGFTGTASAVSANVTVVIAATVNGSKQTASITLSPLQVSALSCSPAIVLSGDSTTCVVTISAAAPAGGAVVTLYGGNASLSIPASVTIAAGANSGTFVANALGFLGRSVAVDAVLNRTSKSLTLSVEPSATIAILGNPSEVSGTSNGSIVNATLAPAGFTGSVVARGTGSVTFAPDSFGNGVYFQNCCAGSNNADYNFTGAAIGGIFNETQGEVKVDLVSRSSFAQRGTASSYRAVFDVRDNNPANHVFYFLTQASNGRLIFFYAVDGGAQQYYFVPKGTEDTLFGAGVSLTVAIVWEGGTDKLYLNGTLVQTGTYTATTPDWSATSNFDLGAYEDMTSGGFNSCDDIISNFTVGQIVQH